MHTTIWEDKKRQKENVEKGLFKEIQITHWKDF